MMTNLMTILERKVFISSNPRIVLSSCPPPCGHFSIQESATGGLSYKGTKFTENLRTLLRNHEITCFLRITKRIAVNEVSKKHRLPKGILQNIPQSTTYRLPKFSFKSPPAPGNPPPTKSGFPVPEPSCSWKKQMFYRY